MPTIIPIKDLKDTTKISQLVHEDAEPIFVTKNGYGEMVIMSMNSYEQTMFELDVIRRVRDAEVDFEAGRVGNPFETTAELRKRHGLEAV